MGADSIEESYPVRVWIKLRYGQGNGGSGSIFGTLNEGGNGLASFFPTTIVGFLSLTVPGLGCPWALGTSLPWIGLNPRHVLGTLSLPDDRSPVPMELVWPFVLLSGKWNCLALETAIPFSRIHLQFLETLKMRLRVHFSGNYYAAEIILIFSSFNHCCFVDDNKCENRQ